MTGWMVALALADDVPVQDSVARGELVVHVVYAEDSSVVRDLYAAAVRKVMRQWRRAQRLSDAPVVLEAPELPELQPVTDASVSVTGLTPPRERLERVVDEAGVARLSVGEGRYVVEATTERGVSRRVEATVGAGDPVTVWLHVSAWEDQQIVTQWTASDGADGVAALGATIPRAQGDIPDGR